MQNSSKLTIRPAELKDLEMVLDWAAAEGWNPGVRDTMPFFAADPSGYLVAELEDQVVGSISAVSYGKDFGFVGLFIVQPGHRGRGYGRLLFQAGLSHLDGRTIGLDGVPAQEENYRRHGFRFAYSTFRYEGTSNSGVPHEVETSLTIVDLKSIPPGALATYDAQVFPAPRPAFLEAWIRQPGSVARGALRSGGMAGYGVLRPCRIGYKIGPLLADDKSSAETLFAALLAAVPGETVFFDVPEPNQAATELALRHGMKPVFNTARMYRGSPPLLDLTRTFGVTTLELG